MVSKDFRELGVHRIRCAFLDGEELTALEPLCNIKEIVCNIAPSDKGGNIIIMDPQEYIEMVSRLLNDQSTYEI